MPIEISELTIKAVVNQEGAGNGAPASPAAATGAAPAAVDKEAIIREAVDRVLDIIKRERER